MHVTCVSACVPQPITPSEDAPSRARYFAATRARRTRAQTSEVIRLDHRDELRTVDGEERDDERGSVSGRPVRLHTRVAELEVRCRHVGQPSFLQFEPPSWRDLHRPRRHAAKRALDGIDGIDGSEQLLHVAPPRGRASHELGAVSHDDPARLRCGRRTPRERHREHAPSACRCRSARVGPAGRRRAR